MVQLGGAGHNNQDVFFGCCEMHIGMKTLEIGDWNMDIAETKQVAHNVCDLANIRGVDVIVRNDDNDKIYKAMGYNGVTSPCQIENVDATNITLRRATGLGFDSADFDSTDYNRGWIIFTCDCPEGQGG